MRALDATTAGPAVPVARRQQTSLNRSQRSGARSRDRNHCRIFRNRGGRSRRDARCALPARHHGPRRSHLVAASGFEPRVQRHRPHSARRTDRTRNRTHGQRGLDQRPGQWRRHPPGAPRPTFRSLLQGQQRRPRHQGRAAARTSDFRSSRASSICMAAASPSTARLDGAPASCWLFQPSIDGGHRRGQFPATNQRQFASLGDAVYSPPDLRSYFGPPAP